MGSLRFSGGLGAALGVSLSFFAAFDAVAENNGVIRFTGAIVEGSCEMGVAANALEARCARGGQAVFSNLSSDPQSAGIQKLPASFGTSQLHWIDASQKQAIMKFVYY